MAEELLINVGVQGDSVSRLSRDVNTLATETTEAAVGIGRLDQATQRQTKAANRAGAEMIRLRQEIKRAKDEMLLAEEGSDRYNRALARAGDLQFRLKDINDKTRASVRDFGETSKNVASAVSGLGGGFMAAQGAITLFGIENEATMQTLVKLQATMSVVTGLAQYADAFTAIDDIIQGVKASSAAAAGDLATLEGVGSEVMTTIQSEGQNATQSMSELSNQSTLVGANLAGVTTVTNAAAGATNAAAGATAAAAGATATLIASNSTLTQQYVDLTRLEATLSISRRIGNSQNIIDATALIAIKRQAIAVSEAALTAEEIGASKLDAINIRLGRHTAQLQAMEAQLIEQRLAGNAAAISSTERNIVRTQGSIRSIQALAATQASANAVLEQNTVLTQENTTTNQQNTNTQEKAGGGILKTIGYMVGFTLAMAAVTYGIQLLIEWINKIPAGVQVKIEVESSALKMLESDLVSINKFTNDWRKAVYEGNKDRIKELGLYAKEEYNFNDKKLSDIKTLAEKEKQISKDKQDYISNYNQIKWRKQFDDYIKMAEDTYWNEVIIKKKVEAQVTGQQSLQKAQKLFTARGGETIFKKNVLQNRDLKSFGDFVAAANKGGLDSFFFETLAVWGIEQDIIDELKKVNDANTIIKELPKLRIIDFGIGKKKGSGVGGGGGSAKFTVGGGEAPKTKTEPIEAYTKDMEVMYTQYIETYKGLNNEEQAINETLIDSTNRFFNTTVRQRILYNQKIENARRADLNNNKEATEKDLEISIGTRNASIEINNKKINDLDISFNNEKDLYNKKITATNKLNEQIEAAELYISQRIKTLNKSKSESVKKAGQIEVDALTKTLNETKSIRDKNLKDLSDEKISIDKLLTERTSAEADLATAVASGANIDTLKEKLDEINNQIIDSAAASSQIVRDLWVNAFESIQMGLDKIGGTFSSLSNMNDLMMTTIDNKTNHEKNSLELSDSYQKASSDKQEKLMYDLDKKNYDSKVKLFEVKKKFDIGVVAIETISGSIAAVTQGIKQFGPVAGAIIGGLEAAVLVASGAMAIKEIQSRSLDAPIPPSSGGAEGAGGAAGAVNIALNPSKTALTSKEENLNMMQSSGKKQGVTVVKVSEINNVQSTVKVRETNSSY